MGTIDRKRIAATTVLEAMGFDFDGVLWQPPPGRLSLGLPEVIHHSPAAIDGDSILALLHQRADALGGATENAPEGAELKAVIAAIAA